MTVIDYLYKSLDKYRKYIFNRRVPHQIKVLGMIRVRNEELIIQDTLEHLSQFCDAIVCFDDASYDKTFSIMSKYHKVIAIIRNYRWLSDPDSRLESETLHRSALLQLSKQFKPHWIFYSDADERFIGDIRGFIDSEESNDVDLVRISLFDAYITPSDKEPFRPGDKLKDFRKFFGPERRDIIMFWKADNPHIKYCGKDAREPNYPTSSRVITKFYCQHYGKSLSIEHWNETCNYYLKHFPYDSYGRKWENRIGKAIHSGSDFGNPIYHWGDELFKNSIQIHPQ